MKQFYAFCLLLLLFALPLAAGTITKTVTFQENDLIFSKTDGYDVVELIGYPALINPGAPRLPRVVLPLVIPAGTRPTKVEIIAQNVVDIPGTYNIIPAQPDIPLPMPGRTFTPVEIPPNPGIYALDNLYPEVEIRINGSGNKSGYRIAHIEIFPLRYIPSKGMLQLATHITYRVEYTKDQSVATVPTHRQKEVFGEAVRAIVANPEDVASFAPRVGTRWSPALLPPGYYEYVIISESPMDTVLERFADWKTKKGIPATVVTVSWINSTYTGYDLQEKIRNFVVDAYTGWGAIYVLLGGSADQKTGGQNIVPARRAWYTTCGVGYYSDEDWIPCDLYYSDLDDDWDGDGDHTYGEIGDNVDMYADVYVGRASVYSIPMAQNFVYKALTYEKNPPTGYIKKLMLPTAILWSSYEERFMQNKIADMPPAGWFVAKMYEREGTLSRQGMIDSMNVGYGMGHWVGHGDEDGIYMGSPYLTSGDADGLVNGDKEGIANSIACFTGAWDETPGGDCFAEHLVNRVGGGLLAAMMNSRYGWGAYVGGYVPGPSDRIDTTFYYSLFYSDIYHLGEAHAVAKDAWVFYADSGQQYDMTRWCIYQLNLFGCPEMPIWTDEPMILTVNFPPSILLGNQNVDITVTSSGSPVNNALVCLQKGTETYASGYTNASGVVILNVEPTSPGMMDITVTAQNHYPYEDTIIVLLPTGPYIVFLKGIIDDSGGGNGNGRINPGETINLLAWARNIGVDTGYGIYAWLSETDPYVSISVDSSYFGNIAADDSASGTPSYVFSVTNTCPDGHNISFDFTAHDVNDSTWESHPLFTVYSPVLTLNNFVVDPSGDQRLYPGETADLVVTLDNDGGEDAVSVTGHLFESNPYITVPDPDADFGNIPPGSSASNSGNPFSVSASSSTPIGESVTFHVEVTSGVYCDTLSFTIVVGAKHYLIWDPDPNHSSGPTIDAALQACSFAGDYNTSLPVANLDEYLAVFVCVGIYSDNYIIDDGSPEATALVNFVNSGGRMYLEGGDVWYWDPQYGGYDFGSLFGINATDDGTSDLATVLGQNTTFTQGMSFSYSGENAWIDYISPTGSGFLIFRNSTPPYDCGVANDAGTYRTVGVSWEFGGLTDGSPPSTKEALADSIMHFFGIFVGVEEELVSTLNLPKVYGLSQSYPNPSNQLSIINYQLPAKGKVSLRLYDVSGRLVDVLVDGMVEAGYHSLRLDAKGYASGIYFYRLTAGGKTITRKMIVVR